MLTGGGDCPGLNAVIRSVARSSIDHGDEVVGVLRGWRGMIEGQLRPLAGRDISGLLPRGGTILRTSRTNPFRRRRRRRAGAREHARPGRAGGDRRGGHARRRGPPEHRARRARGRRPEDHRQRPARHGLHVRFRHRGHHRHRGDRPPALHGRVARPRDGVRGHGPAHGLDRRHGRHGRRRRRDPHPRAAHDRRALLRPDQEPPRPGQGLLDRRRLRGLSSCTTSPASRAVSRRRRPTSTRSATPVWAAWAPPSRRRSKIAPGSRPA